MIYQLLVFGTTKFYLFAIIFNYHDQLLRINGHKNIILSNYIDTNTCTAKMHGYFQSLESVENTILIFHMMSLVFHKFGNTCTVY